MKQQHFCDRTQAGQLLATALTAYTNRSDVLVLVLLSLQFKPQPVKRGSQWVNHVHNEGNITR